MSVLSKLVESTYRPEDVTLLLQDVQGKVSILNTEEREKRNQSGIHYAEMLPQEYIPTEEYMRIYRESLHSLSEETAYAVALLAQKLYHRHGENLVIVSLARAGTPIGILLKWYFKKVYHIDPPHYSISIIRGKGIDIKAMYEITDKYPSAYIQFLDGWIGKGAIQGVLSKACCELRAQDNRFQDLSDELAVLSDPASITRMYGTRKDFLIPNACLNATVSGLVSRTVKLSTMGDNELHGAVFYREQLNMDYTYDFLNSVAQYFPSYEIDTTEMDNTENGRGLREVITIGERYGVTDINKIKPGVGETTRVLLRRIPERVLLRREADQRYIGHILRLCEEKNVPVEYYPLQAYNACGIIKTLSV